jgi:hypothetical protein
MLMPNRSPLTFLRRTGFFATPCRPAPTTAPALQIFHQIPLTHPLPDPQFLLHAEGVPPPDRGRTDIWPHGAEGEEP